MHQILCLRNYSNYFNRIIKKEDSLEAYIALPGSISIQSYRNFNCRDGVNASIVFDWEFEWMPDYLVFHDGLNVESRWFITEAVFQCKKSDNKAQYILTLRRDVIVDNYDKVVTAPCFIEKGMLKQNDPYLFNSEGLSLNQIKKSEDLLKDKSGIAWYIGYLAKNFRDAARKIDLDIKVPIEYTEINNTWPWISYRDSTCDFVSDTSQNVLSIYYRHWLLETDYGAYYRINLHSDITTIEESIFIDANSNLRTSKKKSLVKEALDPLVNTSIASIKSQLYSLKSVRSDYDELIKWNGKTVKYNNGYYTLDIKTVSGEKITDTVKSSDVALFNTLQNLVNSSDIFDEVSTANNDSFRYELNKNQL